ncbi:polysaccharide biosynthesis/export family protein [uncultured Sphingomonas sp.]|uniref:polysaccharide biosynthesis/export family protein n=1 Tax=uncultured Sphingomonas sp. TaxID=158754 RepID=UPI0025FFD31D|nr:polysaccharide biosynthesis/export family protein [uncultured Sphingomonas sp.]
MPLTGQRVRPLPRDWFRKSAILSMLPLAACQPSLDKSVARGPAAYDVIPALNPDVQPGEYRIGPLDTLDVTVFQEPDLSQKGLRVDAAGRVLVPLIGQIQASGQTAVELSKTIAAQLGQRYLVNPQVTVSVVSAVSQRVSVEGSVNEAGVYEIAGRTSLLQALALAKGTSRTAALSQVVVFRNINGQRNAAVFNVSDIRRGAAPDPEIQGNDLIVVGFSNVKAGFRDFLSSSPLLAIFRPF